MATTPQVASIGEEAAELWANSYQGEVLGEAYFSHMAEHTTEPVRRAKLEALTALERCTKELLVAPMERLGISTVPDQSILDGVASGTNFDYRAMLDTVLVFTAKSLSDYTQLRGLVESRDAAVIDQLIAHELALEVFVRRELAGDIDDSLQPIRALSHVTL